MAQIWRFYAYILGETIMNICHFTATGAGVQEAESYRVEGYGEDCVMVDVTNYRLNYSDKYRDGSFYYTDADGVEHKREPVPSEEDRIAAVEATSADNTSEIESNTNAIDDILIMLLDDGSTTDTDTTTEVTE